MNPVRPCGVSDCGSSLPAAVCAFGSRMSLTMSSSSPRQTPIAPQTLCVHSPAGNHLAAVVTAADRGTDDDHDDHADGGENPGERPAHV